MTDFSFISHTIGKAMVAEVSANDMLLTTSEDANDLLGNAYYQGFDGMIISADKISPRFFDLKTRLAGEILQKFSTFQMRLAIVGGVVCGGRVNHDALFGIETLLRNVGPLDKWYDG